MNFYKIFLSTAFLLARVTFFMFLFVAFIFSTSTSCTSKAQSSEHPHLIVNNKDKPFVLEKIKTTDWAKNTYDAMVENISPYVERHKTDPEWILSRYMMNWTPGKHYTDFYAKKNHTIDSMGGNAPFPTVRVALFSRIPANEEAQKYILPPIEELTPYDTSAYMNLINPATGQKDRIKPWVMVENINEQINRLAMESSVIYWLTGKEEYAKFAADILDQFARGAYYQNPIHGHQTFGFISTETIKDDTYQPLMLVYDFVYPYMVKKGYEMKYYQPVWEKFAHTVLVNGYWNNNWFAAESCTIMYAALLLEDKSKRDFYIEHFLEKDTINGSWGHLSVRSTVEKWLTPDGHWKEPGGYHTFPVSNLFRAALTLESHGYKVFEKYPALFDAASVVMKYVYPNLYISSFGDSGRSFPSSDLLEIGLLFAYKYRPEALPALLACMDQLTKYGYYKRNKMDAFALLCYLPELKNEKGYQYEWSRSGTLDFAKFYLQRNGTDKNDGLMYSIQCATYNHNHNNGMSMELYGSGDVMGIDPGKGPYYQHPVHQTYFAQWAAHNTVVAAGASASTPYSGSSGRKNVGQLEMMAMEPMPEADAISPYVSFTDSRYFDLSTETNQQRTMALVRTSAKSGYYVDIFRSNHKSRNDYMYHNIGNSIELLTPEDSPILLQPSRIDLVGDDYPGFRHISKVKATGKYPNDVVALFTLLDETVGARYMKVYMPRNDSQNYYTGYSPRAATAGRYSKLPLPTLMVQNKGEAWTNPFIAVFEPYFGKDGSSVRKVTRLNRSNGSDFVTLLVDGKNGEQQYIFQGVNQTAGENSAANYSFKGYFGIVSLKNNELQYMYLGQGKKLAFGDYIIEGQDDNCNVNVDFSENEITITSNQTVSLTVKKAGIKTVTLNSQELKLKSSGSVATFDIPPVKNGKVLLR